MLCRSDGLGLNAFLELFPMLTAYLTIFTRLATSGQS